MVDISKGYIRLFRQVLEWEWYDNPFVKSIFFHCLFTANISAKKWRDITVKRGQLVTSYEKLAVANGLTIQQTRTALKQLQLTGEIEYQTTNQYTVITVKNFNSYQPNNTQNFKPDNSPTNKQTGGQVTTTNNIDTNSYINISLSSKKITKEEREILTNYVKRKNLAKSSVRAYVNKMIENGDHTEILEAEKRRLQAKEEKKKKEVEVEEVVETPEEQEKIKEIQKRIKERSKRR